MKYQNQEKGNDPLDLPALKVATPFVGEGTIRQKLRKSEVFIIYGSRNYHQAFLFRNQDILEQIELVKEFKLPVILLLDKKLSIGEILNMRTIKGINVIKEIIYDFSDKVKKKEVEKEVMRISIEIGKENMRDFTFRWNWKLGSRNKNVKKDVRMMFHYRLLNNEDPGPQGI